MSYLGENPYEPPQSIDVGDARCRISEMIEWVRASRLGILLASSTTSIVVGMSLKNASPLLGICMYIAGVAGIATSLHRMQKYKTSL